jgi:hypothetical protein
MTPQTFTEQEYMRVIYNERVYLATMKVFFERAQGILLLQWKGVSPSTNRSTNRQFPGL